MEETYEIANENFDGKVEYRPLKWDEYLDILLEINELTESYKADHPNANDTMIGLLEHREKIKKLGNFITKVDIKRKKDGLEIKSLENINENAGVIFHELIKLIDFGRHLGNE